MSKRTLAKIMINTYEYTKGSEFDRTIEYLNMVLYHTRDDRMSDNIQYAIWYIMDIKKQKLKKS